MYQLSLGAGVPLGGTLTLSTCGLTSNNTELLVGTGCPTSALAFGCIAGNDDAGDVPGQDCAANAGASRLIITGTTARVFLVQVGGYVGAPVRSGLRWSYAPPSPTSSPPALRSPTRTPTASATRTRTSTGTRTRTASASKSRKRKA